MRNKSLLVRFVGIAMFLLWVYSMPTIAQAGSSNKMWQEWVTRYSSPGYIGEGGEVLAVDNNGNVYAAGNSQGIGVDYVIVKYDSSGTQLWEARYNGLGNGNDVVADMVVDSAGNVYLTGTSQGIDTDRDYATVKYDTDGNQLWVARYNGTYNAADQANALVFDASGNVYVTGWSYGRIYGRRNQDRSWDCVTIKYDTNGNQLWVARYDTWGNHESGYDLVVNDRGDVYVTGMVVGSYLTIKYNDQGNMLWATEYNSPAGGWAVAKAIAVDTYDNVYVTGYNRGNETGTDYATVKYDARGNQLWVARYNGPGNGEDYAWDIAVDSNGNVYITGDSDGSNSNRDYATIKYDTDGNQLWVARYNGPGNFADGASALAVDNGGFLYVTGKSPGSGTYYDYATIMYDTDGNQLWLGRYNGPNNAQDEAKDIIIDGKGNIYVTGGSMGIRTSWDFATVKYYPLSEYRVSVKSTINQTLLKMSDTINWDMSVDGIGYLDGYFGIEFPSQDFVCLTDLNGNIGKLNKLEPVFSDWPIVTGTFRLLSYTFSGIEPKGNYQLFAVFTESGQDVLNSDNWLAYDFVSFTGVNNPPVFKHSGQSISIALEKGDVGYKDLEFSIAEDPDGDPVTVSVDNLPSPDGNNNIVTYNPTTGVITWKNPTPGDFPGIRFTATDGIYSISKDFTISLYPKPIIGR